MKRILLSSAAVFAFAGAAAADGHLGVTFSGDAELGYNDIVATGGGDNNLGFYSEVDVTIGFAAELDNGLTAAASIDLEDLAGGGGNLGDNYELSLTSDTAGLFFGDTGMAAEQHWTNAGSMDNDGFSEQDDESVLRADLSVAGIDASLSYIVADSAGAAVGSFSADDVTQLSVGAAGTFGNFTVGMAYQEAIPAATVLGGTWTNGDLNVNELFGIFASTSFGGADVTLAYAEDSTAGNNSTGIAVSYPVGPVVLDASYVMESGGADNWDIAATYENGPIAVTVGTDESDDWGLEGSYDVGNGLTLFAGLDDGGEDIYVGGEYDLGSGASLLVSFADDQDADNGDDEIGARDYQEGTTVEVSFEF